MKLKMLKIRKAGGRLPKGGNAAFGAGGERAFRDPATMAAPDQAFTAAMAQPQQGEGTGPTMPPLPPMPQS